jgi:retron-type reverse transcriptase
MHFHNHEYKDIISLENLLGAWQEFLKGKRFKKDVAEFSLNLMDNIISLHEDLKNKTYRHGEYQYFKISDPKPRDIHKATVRDRLLHHAIYRALYPYFDTKFVYDSYSCRNFKGTHRAINRFRDFARKVSKNNTKNCWVLKCDIRKFFASIDHLILKKILKKHIYDVDILWLLEQVIDSFDSSVGLPLGNLTSQLLVNIYMNEFDHFVKRELKIGYYIRYADDFVILSQNEKYLEKLTLKIYEFLKQNMDLELHPKKVFIKTFASGIDFLGFVHFSHHRVLRTVTKRRMFKKLSVSNCNVNYGPEKVASYRGLLKHGNCYKIFLKF